MKVSVLCYIVSTPSTQIIEISGRSMKPYLFKLDRTTNKYLLHGKPLDVTEWNKIAEDILCSDSREFYPVIALVQIEKEAVEVSAPVPIAKPSIKKRSVHDIDIES